MGLKTDTYREHKIFQAYTYSYLYFNIYTPWCTAVCLSIVVMYTRPAKKTYIETREQEEKRTPRNRVWFSFVHCFLLTRVNNNNNNNSDNKNMWQRPVDWAIHFKKEVDKWLQAVSRSTSRSTCPFRREDSNSFPLPFQHRKYLQCFVRKQW